MTTSESIERTVKCPLCENSVSVNKLADLGLSQEQLVLLTQYAKDRTLGNVLEITLRRLDPEKTNAELQIKDAISRLIATARDMLDKHNREAMEFVERFSKANEEDRNRLVKTHEEETENYMHYSEGIIFFLLVS
jgi:hypothetical protein